MRRRLPAVLGVGLVLLALGPAIAQEAAPEEGAPSAQAPAPATPAVPAASPVSPELKERAGGFYSFLGGKQANIHSLFQNDNFREYFTAEDVLENYIAYLSSELGEKRFRKYRIERTELLDTRQVDADHARVRVKLIGRHWQVFFFWDNSIVIENEWRRVQGDWYVFPPPF